MTQISSNSIIKSYTPPVLPKKDERSCSAEEYAAKYEKSNLVTQYLEKLALQNQPLKEYWNPEFVPSGVGNYNNMTVKDINGNIVQEVKYSQDGNKITEAIKVHSLDGSNLNKVITADGNKKTMTIDVKDKDGNSLIKENRTYEKLDDDTAVSTRNGEEYRISGLKGNVIKVEHNGEKRVVDFNKMVFSETENLDQSPTGKNITDEQKEFLISRFKNRPGDIILTLAKEVDKFIYMDGNEYEGWYCGYSGHPPDKRDEVIRAIKTCRNADSMLELHELGHGVNEFNDKSGKCWSDINKDYHSVRKKEIDNFYNTVRSSDMQNYMQKFTNGEFMQSRGLNKEECKLVAANEEFAETFGFFNNIDINTTDFTNYRTTMLMRYMPESSRMAFNASKSI